MHLHLKLGVKIQFVKMILKVLLPSCVANSFYFIFYIFVWLFISVLYDVSTNVDLNKLFTYCDLQILFLRCVYTCLYVV